MRFFLSKHTQDAAEVREAQEAATAQKNAAHDAHIALRALKAKIFDTQTFAPTDTARTSVEAYELIRESGRLKQMEEWRDLEHLRLSLARVRWDVAKATLPKDTGKDVLRNPEVKRFYLTLRRSIVTPLLTECRKDFEQFLATVGLDMKTASDEFNTLP